MTAYNCFQLLDYTTWQNLLRSIRSCRRRS